MKKNISQRRNVLKILGATPIAIMAGLSGCSTSDNSTKTDPDTGDETGDNTGDETGDNTGGDNTSDETTSSEWASGTTSLIKADYPEDSIFESGTSCSLSLTQPTTEGPCYFQDDTGEDISTGLSGLPMQLCLRLVDSDCQPLEDYVVEVWHCDHRGIYSGDTSDSADASSFAGSFCTDNDSASNNSTWYRGQLTSDTNGRVNFKSCFPGWYSGRTIHIHFSVKDSLGNSSVISQFCFTDALTKEICTTHEIYNSRGEQDQTLAGGRDTVFPANGYEDFVMNTQQNSDGTLLAYHTIQIA